MCVVAFTLCLLLGCSGEKRPAPQVIRVGTGTPLITFDPHRSETGPAFTNYLTLVYDGLTRVDSANLNTPKPDLATAWEWTSPTTIEMQLRDDVSFSDGTPFDAAAAKANLTRMIEAEGPRINTVASVRSSEVLSRYHLRIHLHFPDPTLLYNLALSPGMMVSPAAFDNPDLDLRPVGTGPFTYDSVNSTIGDVHRFTVNPHYHGMDPTVLAPLELHVLTDAKARLNALISGQIDLTVVGPAEAGPATNFGFTIARRANRWFGMTLLDRNGELVPEFADPRVRRALGYAIDRQALADVVFFGYARPSSQPMSKGELGHVDSLETYYRYDPDKSRALLREAGVDNFSFTVPIVPNSSAEFETMQAYLRKVGINMIIKVIEPGTLGAVARSKQFPVNTIGYPSFDPDSRHLAIWDTQAAFNPFRIAGAVTDRLATEARRSLDNELREANYQAYFDVVVKDVYSLVFLQLDDLVAYDPGRVEGVVISRYIDPMLREVRLRRSPQESPAALQGDH